VGPPGTVAAVRTLLAAAVHGPADLSVSPAHGLSHPVAGPPAGGGTFSHCPCSPSSAGPRSRRLATSPGRRLATSPARRLLLRHRPARAIGAYAHAVPRIPPRVRAGGRSGHLSAGVRMVRPNSGPLPAHQPGRAATASLRVDHGFPEPPEDIDGQQFSSQIITARPTRNPIKRRELGKRTCESRK
jgi:hypothetical protein